MKDLQCSWAGRINMAILQKLIWELIAIPIKITTQFVTDLEWTILNFIWKHTQEKIHRIPNKILNNKRNDQGSIIHNFKN